MSRYGEHTPTVYEPMWNKISQLSGIDPADVKQMSIFIREAMLAQMLFYWPEIQELINGKQQAIPQAPQMPRVPSMQQWGTPIPAAPAMPELQPALLPTAPPPVPAPHLQPADQTPAKWVPAEYEPPKGEDVGVFKELEYGPEWCAQCRDPLRQIQLGETAHIRLSRQGMKEYRHQWHLFGYWQRPEAPQI